MTIKTRRDAWRVTLGLLNASENNRSRIVLYLQLGRKPPTHFFRPMGDRTSDRVDSLIAKLLSLRDKKPGTTCNLSADEVTFLIDESTNILVNQPALLELEAPIQISKKKKPKIS